MPSDLWEFARSSYQSLFRRPTGAAGALLADIPMFSRLDERFTNRVARCLRPRSPKGGVVIIELGGNSKDLYLIQEGTVRVEIQTATGDAQVTDLGPDSCFGDVHLLSDIRAHISATAVTDCELLVLTKRRFEKLTRGHTELRDAIWASFKAAVLVDALATVPLLSSLTSDNLVELAARFEWRSFVSGSVLFYQADYGNEFHVIRRGMARVIVTQSDGAKVERHLHEGDFFGELALLGDGTRQATVRAGTDLETFVLSRDAFRDLLSRFPELEDRINAEKKGYVLPRSGGRGAG